MSRWMATFYSTAGARYEPFVTVPPEQPMPIAERDARPGDYLLEVMRLEDFAQVHGLRLAPRSR